MKIYKTASKIMFCYVYHYSLTHTYNINTYIYIYVSQRVSPDRFIQLKLSIVQQLGRFVIKSFIYIIT